MAHYLVKLSDTQRMLLIGVLSKVIEEHDRDDELGMAGHLSAISKQVIYARKSRAK